MIIPSTIPERYADLSTCDEFDLFVFSWRGDIDMLEEQIRNLDASIQQEVAKLKRTSEELEHQARLRSRLLLLRQAMLRFVRELEAYDELHRDYPELP